MTRTRPHTDHQSRLDWWRRQIQRQPKTKLTVASFCRQLGISVPTFYYWKQRVMAEPQTFSQRVAEASLTRPPSPPAAPFLPVSIVNRGRSGCHGPGAGFLACLFLGGVCPGIFGDLGSEF